MALDDLTDPQVTAMLVLLKEGLNAELAGAAGEDVVVGQYGWPAVTNERIPALAHPAIAVWREEERLVERGMHRTERRVTFRVDYVAPATPLDRINERWALLQTVWGKCVDLLCKGWHADVEEGARLLMDAGFTDLTVDGKYPFVKYTEATAADRGTYPTFLGRVQMQHREDVDISALPAVTLHTKVYPDGLPEDERDGYAPEIHTNPP